MSSHQSSTGGISSGVSQGRLVDYGDGPSGDGPHTKRLVERSFASCVMPPGPGPTLRIVTSESAP